MGIRKKILSIIVCLIVGCTFIAPSLCLVGNKSHTYVSIVREHEKVKVHVMNLTKEEANIYKKNEKNIVVFGKEDLVLGSKKDYKKYSKLEKKEKHEKISELKKSKNSKILWNIEMVKSQKAIETSSNKVKVALIDSGIDYTQDIDVYLRKNFVQGQDDISIIYEDLIGHGTSIAGILAAKDNDEGITGINPNIQLYSARVLDENLSAPISRIVEAIYWAIENDVNIISISFGTLNNSEVLHKAIQDAYDKGILIIAAAGNHGVIEYPAAYDEVIAVGSVGCKGEHSEGSAVGEDLELVAPGEQILSTGAFGGLSVTGGTSMAVPHVVGIASLLWEKDLTCSAEFIRLLLDISANKYGEKVKYGYGLVDYEYALEIYDKIKSNSTMNLEGSLLELYEQGTISENDRSIPVYNDVEYVEGSWVAAGHQNLADLTSAVSGNKLSLDAIKIVKLGAIAPDTYITGMSYHPEWHGFTSYQPGGVFGYFSNYMSSYIYLTEIAAEVYNGADPRTVVPSVNITITAKDNIIRVFRENNAGFVDRDLYDATEGNISWSTALNNNTVNNTNKSLFIYGMALHTASDMFAHSSYDGISGSYITHNSADLTDYVPNRYECTKVFVSYLIAHIKRFEDGSISDYYNMASNPIYDGSFTLGRFSTYAKEISETFYNNNSSEFNDITR